MRQQHCWSSFTFGQTQLFEMFLTSSKHMTFSLDNDVCNGLVQWTSVVMVSVLASYVSSLILNPNPCLLVRIKLVSHVTTSTNRV